MTHRDPPRDDPDDPDGPARIHLHVSGRVQGVWFRKSTQLEARDLGVRGWVRNLADGRVEVVAEGPRPALEALIAFCRRGPPHARVEDVAIVWEAPTGTFDGFQIRPR